MQDMMYGTEDLDVHSKMDDAARAIQAHPAVIQFSQRNTTRTGCLGTSKATGFQVTLQCFFIHIHTRKKSFSLMICFKTVYFSQIAGSNRHLSAAIHSVAMSV